MGCEHTRCGRGVGRRLLLLKGMTSGAWRQVSRAQGTHGDEEHAGGALAAVAALLRPGLDVCARLAHHLPHRCPRWPCKHTPQAEGKTAGYWCVCGHMSQYSQTYNSMADGCGSCSAEAKQY